jgi:hypothetical protein
MNWSLWPRECSLTSACSRRGAADRETRQTAKGTWSFMKDRRIYLDAVHVIETLRPGDDRTGRRLFEDLEPLAIAARPLVTARFWSAQTRGEFLEHLRSIAHDSRTHGHFPLLHIEAHGSPQGIQVSSGEFLTWLEFKGELTAINEISHLNLLVILAACDGAHILSIIQPTDRAPVHTLIGPNRTVSAGEIERASLAFYRTLFRVNDGVAAWRAMNDAVAPAPLTFSVFTAEYVLRYVMRGYLKTQCTDEVLASRQRMKELELERAGMSQEAIVGGRERFRQYQRDHRSRFAEIRNHFLFCDLYPENDARFSVTFDDCLKDPSVD